MVFRFTMGAPLKLIALSSCETARQESIRQNDRTSLRIAGSARKSRRRNLLLSPGEHSGIRNVFRALRRVEAVDAQVGVRDTAGRLAPGALRSRKASRPRPLLPSLEARPRRPTRPPAAPLRRAPPIAATCRQLGIPRARRRRRADEPRAAISAFVPLPAKTRSAASRPLDRSAVTPAGGMSLNDVMIPLSARTNRDAPVELWLSPDARREPLNSPHAAFASRCS